MAEQKTIAEILKTIFEGRKTKNRSYSSRAFARDLGVSPGRLSEIMSGQNIPGNEVTRRIVQGLKLNFQDSQWVMDVVREQKNLHQEIKGARQLATDEFSLIADRKNFSLLCLMETDGFQSDIGWMAKRLRTTKPAVEKILERLIRLQLVVKEDGVYKSVHKDVTTTHNVSSDAIRKYHRQGIEHAMESLQEDGVELRDITSIEMPADPRKLSDIRVLIRDFRRKVAGLLESGEKTEVYRLNIQLVPVTKPSPSARKGAKQ
jgi:uncharacterized protein (TIGR02147 family)